MIGNAEAASGNARGDVAAPKDSSVWLHADVSLQAVWPAAARCIGQVVPSWRRMGQISPVDAGSAHVGPAINVARTAPLTHSGRATHTACASSHVAARRRAWVRRVFIRSRVAWAVAAIRPGTGRFDRARVDVVYY